MSRSEELIQKLINGESVENWCCHSRLEEYLIACINKTGSQGCPVPKSRIEVLLKEYADCCNQPTGPDTSDATATPNDLRLGKTAYVCDEKIEGTIEDYDGAYEGLTAPEKILDISVNGEYDVFDCSKVKVEANPALAVIDYYYRTKTWDSYIVDYGKKLFSTLEGVEEINIYMALDCFFGATWITKLPKLKYTWLTYESSRSWFSNEFRNCSSLESVDIEIKSHKYDAYDVDNAFSGCNKLKTINMITPTGHLNVVRGRYLFSHCSALESINIPIYISANSSYVSTNTFYGCKALKDITFEMINTSITLGVAGSYGDNLTIDSLLSACRAIINNRTLTVGSTNLEKLASVYVNSEGFQVEEGAEGAISVTDYMTIKSCTLA